MLSPTLFVVFVLVLPVCFGTHNQFQCSRYCKRDNRYNYEVGKIYQYNYEGITRTLINGTSDSEARVKLFADANIHILSHCDFALELEKVRIEEVTQNEARVTIHRPIDGEVLASFAKSLSANYLYFSFQNGKVETLCPANEEQTWAFNVKKAILSIFQNSMVNFTSNTLVYENDVSGNCETVYSVNEDTTGDNVISINKTKNLNACSNRGSSYSNVHSASYLKRNNKQSQSILRSSQNCNQKFAINTSTNGVTLLSAFCEEKHLFKPFANGDTGAVTVSHQSIKFVEEIFAGKFHSRGTFTKLRTNLIFEKSKHRLTGANGDKFFGISQILNKLHDKSVDGLDKDVPRLFSKLVDIVRDMDSNSMVELLKPISSEKRAIFLDALRLVGTSDSIKVIPDLRTLNLVTDQQVESVITSLALLGDPSIAIIRSFNILFDTNILQSRKTAVLSLSSLVHQYCKMDQQCGKQQEIQKSVSIIEEPLKNSCTPNSPIEHEAILLALKAIGNTGITTVLDYLDRCSQDKDAPVELRLAAIAAFRRVPCHRNTKYGNLKILFANHRNDVEIRIASYLAITRCMSYSTFSEIRDVLIREDVGQVGSFVWTHLTNLQETSSKWKQSIRGIVENYFLRNKFVTDWRKYSRNYEMSHFFDSLNAGGTVESNVIFTQDSYLPRSALLNLTLDLFGETVNLFEVGGRFEGFEDVVENFFGRGGYFPHEAIQDVLKSTRNSTNFDVRKVGNEASRGSVYAKVFGNELGYKQFKDIEDLIGKPTNARGAIAFLVDLFRKNDLEYMKTFKFLESSYTVPSLLGFPLTLDVHGTATVALTAKGQLDITSNNINVSGKFSPSAVVRVKGNMLVDTFVSKMGLELISVVNSNTYLQGHAYLRGRDQIDLKLSVPTQQVDVINVDSRIYVVRNEERTEMAGIVENEEKWKSCTGRPVTDITGMQFCTEMRYANASLNSDAPYFPLTGPFNFGISLRKTDTLNAYLFKFSQNPLLGRYEMFMDTPGSRINRNIHAEVELDRLSGKISSPFVNATLNLFNPSPSEFQIKSTLNNRNAVLVDFSIVDQLQDHTSKLHFDMKYFEKLFALVNGKISYGENKVDWDLAVRSDYVEPIDFIGQLQISLKNEGEIREFDGYNVNASLKSGSFEGDISGKVRFKPSGIEAEMSSNYDYHKSNVHNVKAKLILQFEKYLSGVSFDFSSTQKPDLNTALDLKLRLNQYTELSAFLKMGKIEYNFYYILKGLITDSYKDLSFIVSMSCPKRDIDFKVDLTHIHSKFKYYINTLMQINKQQRMQLRLDMSTGDSNDGTTYATDVLLYYPWQEWTLKAMVSRTRGNVFGASIKGFREIMGGKKKTIVIVSGELHKLLNTDSYVDHTLLANVDFPEYREVLKGPWVVSSALRHFGEGLFTYTGSLNMRKNDNILDIQVSKRELEMNVYVSVSGKRMFVIETKRSDLSFSFLAAVNVYQHFELSGKFDNRPDVKRLKIIFFWDKSKDLKTSFYGELNLTGVSLSWDYPGQKVSADIRIGDSVDFLKIKLHWGLQNPKFVNLRLSIEPVPSGKSYVAVLETPFEYLESQQLNVTLLETKDTTKINGGISWRQENINFEWLSEMSSFNFFQSLKIGSSFKLVEKFHVLFRYTPSADYSRTTNVALFELNDNRIDGSFNSSITQDSILLDLSVDSSTNTIQPIVGTVKVAPGLMNSAISWGPKIISVKYKFERSGLIIDIVTPFAGLEQTYAEYVLDRSANKIKFDAKMEVMKRKNSAHILWTYENAIGTAEGSVFTSGFGTYKLRLLHSNSGKFQEEFYLEKDSVKIFAVDIAATADMTKKENMLNASGEFVIGGDGFNFLASLNDKEGVADVSGKWGDGKFNNAFKLNWFENKLHWRIESTRFRRDFDLTVEYKSISRCMMQLQLPNEYGLNGIVTEDHELRGNSYDYKLKITTPYKTSNMHVYNYANGDTFQYFATWRFGDSQASYKIFATMSPRTRFIDKLDFVLDIYKFKSIGLNFAMPFSEQEQDVLEPTLVLKIDKNECFNLRGKVDVNTQMKLEAVFNISRGPTNSEKWQGNFKVNLDFSNVYFILISDTHSYHFVVMQYVESTEVRLFSKSSGVENNIFQYSQVRNGSRDTYKVLANLFDQKYYLTHVHLKGDDVMKHEIHWESTLKEFNKVYAVFDLDFKNNVGHLEMSRNDIGLKTSYSLVSKENEIEAKFYINSQFSIVSNVSFNFIADEKFIIIQGVFGSYKGRLELEKVLDSLNVLKNPTKFNLTSKCRIEFEGESIKPFLFVSTLEVDGLSESAATKERHTLHVLFKSNLADLALLKTKLRYISDRNERELAASFAHNNATLGLSNVATVFDENPDGLKIDNLLTIETPEDLFGVSTLKSSFESSSRSLQSFDVISQLKTPNIQYKYTFNYTGDSAIFRIFDAEGKIENDLELRTKIDTDNGKYHFSAVKNYPKKYSGHFGIVEGWNNFPENIEGYSDLDNSWQGLLAKTNRSLKNNYMGINFALVKENENLFAFKSDSSLEDLNNLLLTFSLEYGHQKMWGKAFRDVNIQEQTVKYYVESYNVLLQNENFTLISDITRNQIKANLSINEKLVMNLKVLNKACLGKITLDIANETSTYSWLFITKLNDWQILIKKSDLPIISFTLSNYEWKSNMNLRSSLEFGHASKWYSLLFNVNREFPLHLELLSKVSGKRYLYLNVNLDEDAATEDVKLQMDFEDDVFTSVKYQINGSISLKSYVAKVNALVKNADKYSMEIQLPIVSKELHVYLEAITNVTVYNMTLRGRNDLLYFDINIPDFGWKHASILISNEVVEEINENIVNVRLSKGVDWALLSLNMEVSYQLSEDKFVLNWEINSQEYKTDIYRSETMGKFQYVYYNSILLKLDIFQNGEKSHFFKITSEVENMKGDFSAVATIYEKKPLTAHLKGSFDLNDIKKMHILFSLLDNIFFIEHEIRGTFRYHVKKDLVDVVLSIGEYMSDETKLPTLCHFELARDSRDTQNFGDLRMVVVYKEHVFNVTFVDNKGRLAFSVPERFDLAVNTTYELHRNEEVEKHISVVLRLPQDDPKLQLDGKLLTKSDRTKLTIIATHKSTSKYNLDVTLGQLYDPTEKGLTIVFDAPSTVSNLKYVSSESQKQIKAFAKISDQTFTLNGFLSKDHFNANLQTPFSGYKNWNLDITVDSQANSAIAYLQRENSKLTCTVKKAVLNNQVHIEMELKETGENLNEPLQFKVYLILDPKYLAGSFVVSEQKMEHLKVSLSTFYESMHLNVSSTSRWFKNIRLEGNVITDTYTRSLDVHGTWNDVNIEIRGQQTNEPNDDILNCVVKLGSGYDVSLHARKKISSQKTKMEFDLKASDVGVASESSFLVSFSTEVVARELGPRILNMLVSTPWKTFEYLNINSELNADRRLDSQIGFNIFDYNVKSSSSFDLQNYLRHDFNVTTAKPNTETAIDVQVHVDLLNFDSSNDFVTNNITILTNGLVYIAFDTQHSNTNKLYNLHTNFGSTQDVKLNANFSYPVVIQYSGISSIGDEKLYTFNFTKELISLELLDYGVIEQYQYKAKSIGDSSRFEISYNRSSSYYTAILEITKENTKYNYDFYINLDSRSLNNSWVRCSGTYINNPQLFEFLLVSEGSQNNIHLRAHKQQYELLLLWSDFLEIDLNLANAYEPHVSFSAKDICISFLSCRGKTYDLKFLVNTHSAGRNTEVLFRQRQHFKIRQEISMGLSYTNGTNSMNIETFCRHNEDEYFKSSLDYKVEHGKYDVLLQLTERIQYHIYLRPTFNKFMVHSYLFTDSYLPDLIMAFALNEDETVSAKYMGTYLSADRSGDFIFLKATLRPRFHAMFRSSVIPFLQFLSVLETSHQDSKLSWYFNAESELFGNWNTGFIMAPTTENLDVHLDLGGPETNAYLTAVIPFGRSQDLSSKFLVGYNGHTSGFYFVNNTRSSTGTWGFQSALIWMNRKALADLQTIIRPGTSSTSLHIATHIDLLQQLYITYKHDFSSRKNLFVQINDCTMEYNSSLDSEHVVVKYIDPWYSTRNSNVSIHYMRAVPIAGVIFSISNPTFVRDVGFELGFYFDSIKDFSFHGSVSNYITEPRTKYFERGLIDITSDRNSLLNVTLLLNDLIVSSNVDLKQYDDGYETCLEFSKNNLHYSLKHSLYLRANNSCEFEMQIASPYEYLKNFSAVGSVNLLKRHTTVDGHVILNSVRYLAVEASISDTEVNVNIENAICKLSGFKFENTRSNIGAMVYLDTGSEGSPLQYGVWYKRNRFFGESLDVMLPGHKFQSGFGFGVMDPYDFTAHFRYNENPFDIRVKLSRTYYSALDIPTNINIYLEVPWRAFELSHDAVVDNFTIENDIFSETIITFKWDVRGNVDKQMTYTYKIFKNKFESILTGYGLSDDLIVILNGETGLRFEFYYLASKHDEFLFDISSNSADGSIEKAIIVKYLPAKIHHGLHLVLNTSETDMKLQTAIKYFNFNSKALETIRANVNVTYDTLEIDGFIETIRNRFAIKTTNLYVESESNGYGIETQLNEKEPLTLSLKYSTEANDRSVSVSTGYGSKTFDLVLGIPTPREITAKLTHELYGNIFNDAVLSLRLNHSTLLWAKIQWTYGLLTKFQRTVLSEYDDTSYVVEAIALDFLEVFDNEAGRQLVEDVNMFFSNVGESIESEVELYKANFETYKIKLSKLYNSDVLYIKSTVDYLMSLYPINAILEVYGNYYTFMWETISVDWLDAFSFVWKSFDDGETYVRSAATNWNVSNIKENTRKYLKAALDKCRKSAEEMKLAMIRALDDLDTNLEAMKESTLATLQPVLNMLDDFVMYTEQKLVVLQMHLLEFLDSVQMYVMELQETKEMLKAYVVYVNWLEELHFTDLLEPISDFIESLLETIANDYKAILEDHKPYVEALLDTIFGDYDGLSDLPAVVDVRNMANKIYYRTVWIWNYNNVTEGLKNFVEDVYDDLDKYLLTISDMFMVDNHDDSIPAVTYDNRVHSLYESNNYIFRPDIGLIEINQRLPVEWNSFNELPKYHEHPVYKSVVRKRRDVQEQVRNFNVKDFVNDNFIGSADDEYDLESVEEFKSLALLVGSSHYLSFNGQYFEFAQPCSYVLIEESIQHLFSVNMNYERIGNSVQKKSLTVFSDGNSFELLQNGTVLLNKRQTDLPIRKGDVHVGRDENNLYLKRGDELEIRCNLYQELCTFEVSAKVNGLLGTNHGGPHEISSANFESFAENWVLGEECTGFVVANVGHDTFLVCDQIFLEDGSPMRPYFDFVATKPFHQMCNAAQRTKSNTICSIVVAYKLACEYVLKMQVELPEKCQQCILPKENMAVMNRHEETHIFKKTNSTLDKSTDVVLIVDIDCKFKTSDMANLLDNAFKESAANSNNRYSIIGYSTNLDMQAEIYTSNNLIWQQANRVRKILETSYDPTNKFVARNQNADAYFLKEALQLALNLNYRHEVPKTVVWANCRSNEDDSNLDAYFDIINEVVNRDVKFHSISENGCPDGSVCTVIPKATNGTSYPLNKGHRIDKTWAKSVVGAYQTSPCHSCKCTTTFGDVPQVVCTTCMSPIVKYLMGVRNYYRTNGVQWAVNFPELKKLEMVF